MKTLSQLWSDTIRRPAEPNARDAFLVVVPPYPEMGEALPVIDGPPGTTEFPAMNRRHVRMAVAQPVTAIWDAELTRPAKPTDKTADYVLDIEITGRWVYRPDR